MPIAFANHFFQSPLKQRLVMLTKKTSSPIRALKFGLALPLTLLFALVFRQAPAIAQAVEAPASKSADATPSFPGGMNALMEYLGKNVQYPESAKAANAEGMVVVKFMVGLDGSITDVQEVATKQPKHPDLVKEAIRAVSAMPKWIPAVENGKIVKKEYTLPVSFRLAPPAPVELLEVDQAPVFPGGEAEMFAFLVKNIQYPDVARKEGATGMVIVQFVVEADGALSSFNILRSPRPDFADEAIRVLKLMPKFNPAMKNGEAVRVNYTLPLKFKL
jgi:TonB family protein